MNILLLSVGRRNNLVRYFKNALAGTGKVVAADCSSLSPALYEADRFAIIPAITDKAYPERVLALCESERIGGIVSLIDPEVSILAAHSERFAAVGAKVVASSWSQCELALNKSAMYRWLSGHGYPCVKHWTDIDAFRGAVASGAARFPVVVKPIRGSASRAVSVVYSLEETERVLSRREEWLIQEQIMGQEIGADLYADLLTGRVVSVFTRKKLQMCDGETSQAVSFSDPRLSALLERFVTEAGFRGVIDIDLFASEGDYYILDVNPRFGGGYPLAHECGCDFPALILNNLNGIANKERCGAYKEGVCMMKYSDVVIRKETELARPQEQAASSVGSRKSKE